MNVRELIYLADWIQAEIVSAKLDAAYDRLLVPLQQNARQNQQVPFTEQWGLLSKALRSVRMSLLSEQQTLGLNRLGFVGILGDEAAVSVDEYINSADLASREINVREMRAKLESALGMARKLQEAIEPFRVKELQPERDHVIVHLRFSGDAGIKTIPEFKKRAGEWDTIARGLSAVAGASPDDFKVVGADTGSIVLTLLVGGLVAKSLLSRLTQILAIAAQVQELQLNAARIRQESQRFQHVDAVYQLQLEKAEKEAQSAELLRDSIVEQISKVEDGESMPDGGHASLANACRELVGFLLRGGKVDPVLPQIDEDTTDSDDGEDSQSDGSRERLAAEQRALSQQVARLTEQIHEQQKMLERRSD